HHGAAAGLPARRHRQPLTTVLTPGSPHALQPVAADTVPAALLPPVRAAGTLARRVNGTPDGPRAV
ncbi:hypothetical protein, partial [Streptomyces massasporeus]|uniref:hypothetical protein n=1 Tax=Streptomyces massasporeus TaxID=67324 RepID=UPI003355CD52